MSNPGWNTIDLVPHNVEVLVLCKDGCSVAEYDPDMRQFYAKCNGELVYESACNESSLVTLSPAYWMALLEPPN
jgi:hypothetical protein